MVTIKKHKLVFGADYEDPLREEYLYHILIRVYEPALKVLCCDYILPETASLASIRRLYRNSRDKVLAVRENEDRANEVS